MPVVYAVSFSRLVGGAAHNGSDPRAGGQGNARTLLSFREII
jgi:hypothetical protein